MGIDECVEFDSYYARSSRGDIFLTQRVYILQCLPTNQQFESSNLGTRWFNLMKPQFITPSIQRPKTTHVLHISVIVRFGFCCGLKRPRFSWFEKDRLILDSTFSFRKYCNLNLNPHLYLFQLWRCSEISHAKQNTKKTQMLTKSYLSKKGPIQKLKHAILSKHLKTFSKLFIFSTASVALHCFVLQFRQFDVF